MITYVSVAFTLIALIAGMYLLAKSKAENLGKFFTLVSYFIVIVAFLSLLCQMGRGTMMMACSTGICPPSEKCMPGMTMHKEIMMRSGDGEEECFESRSHCGGMSHCCAMHHEDCCKGGDGKDGCMKGGEDHDMKKGCMMGKDSVK